MLPTTLAHWLHKPIRRRARTQATSKNYSVAANPRAHQLNDDDGVARVLIAALQLRVAVRALRAALAAGLAPRVPAALLGLQRARAGDNGAHNGVRGRVRRARGDKHGCAAAAPLLWRGRHAAGDCEPHTRGDGRVRVDQGAQQRRALQHAVNA